MQAGRRTSCRELHVDFDTISRHTKHYCSCACQSSCRTNHTFNGPSLGEALNKSVRVGPDYSSSILPPRVPDVMLVDLSRAKFFPSFSLQLCLVHSQDDRLVIANEVLAALHRLHLYLLNCLPPSCWAHAIKFTYQEAPHSDQNILKSHRFFEQLLLCTGKHSSLPHLIAAQDIQIP